LAKAVAVVQTVVVATDTFVVPLDMLVLVAVAVLMVVAVRHHKVHVANIPDAGLLAQCVLSGVLLVCAEPHHSHLQMLEHHK
jgi:hypothetical protein